jgi:TRAP-type C4-dicarboxylate transport system substrate-binding protein
MWGSRMRRLVTLIAATAAATVLSTSVRTEVTLRASHQFPGGKGDVREQGVVVLSDAWLGGGMASTKVCIRNPDDVKGLKFRAAGPTFAAMWRQAGASIVSVASNENLYGILDRHS